MSDSPRWCEICQGFGDHHTDRHTPTCPLAGHETPVLGPHKVRVVAPNGYQFEIGVCDDHHRELVGREGTDA